MRQRQSWRQGWSSRCVLPARLSPAALLAGGYLLLAGLVLAYIGSGRLESTRVTFFVWMIPYVAFYFGRAATLRITAVTAAALAVAVAVLADTLWAAALAWLSTMVAVTTVALFVLWATARMRESEAAAQAAALHDPLTGLANRVLWARELEQALADLGDLGGHLVVILVDLDEFKGVNDTFGHPAGDALLAQVAPRLASVMRPQDTIARLGGDEFALLAHDRTGNLDADALAARVLTVLAAPYSLPGGEQAYAPASVGVVDTARPRPPADLLRDADVAMYEAKAAGRNRAVRFGTQMAARAAEEHHELLTALRTALARGQCTVVYQAVYALTSSAPVAAEALLRWNHPELGAVPPTRFIPMAEAAGLMEELTGFVLADAISQLAAWRERGGVGAEDFAVSVNLAAPDLHAGLMAAVLALTGAHQQSRRIEPDHRGDRGCFAGRPRGRRPAQGAARRRGPGLPGRLRLGLLLPGPPRAATAGRDQARPGVPAGRRRPATLGAGRCDPGRGSRPGSDGGGRGGGDP